MKYANVIIAIILALTFRIFVVSVYKVTSPSMAPQIWAGDYVLASQISYGFKFAVNQQTYFKTPPQKGELVVFQQGGKIVIKRVMAEPNDIVEYNQDHLTINKSDCKNSDPLPLADQKHTSFTETCVSLSTKIIRSNEQSLANPAPAAPVRLGQDQYLVASDNRTTENNPNPIEIIKYDQIVGKPWFIWMSYGSTQDFISSTLGFRWNRILTILN
ncbi:MAG: signal peptidase I [Pseudobdellovibrio sp.]